MKTTFTKTELSELLSLKIKENRELKRENTEHKDRLQMQLNIIDNLKTLIGQMYNETDKLMRGEENL
jgi:hypothetical protein